MKKLITLMIMGLILVGCGKSVIGPSTPETISFVWDGTSGSNFLYAKNIIYLSNENYTSEEKTYDLKNSFDFKSNLEIIYTTDNYDNNIDYSKHPKQIWIDKKGGTIRIVGNKDNYFRISFYY